jgi:hypothetical protein
VEVDVKMEEFKDKKARKEKVQKDVDKFISSLPTMVIKPLVTSMVKPQKPPLGKPIDKEDEGESDSEDKEITERELTQKYLVKKLKTKDFGKVDELKLRDQKIISMKGIERFVNLKVLNLEGNKIRRLESMKHFRQLEELYMRNNLIDSLKGLDGCHELMSVDFSVNRIDTVGEYDLSNCKKIIELDLSDNPITSFAGLKYLSELDNMNISRNKNVRDLSLLPPLLVLSKLSAEYCKITNLKFIHTKFPNLNVGNFRNNDMKFYEDIEHIKDIEYLAELDIRNNPLEKTPAIQDIILLDVPDLEIYNDIELLEPGFKFKLENEQIKKYLEDTKDKEDDTVYEGIIEDAFIKISADTGEKLTTGKLRDKFDEAERNHMKNDAELLKAQMSISANLVPLTRDENRIKDVVD